MRQDTSLEENIIVWYGASLCDEFTTLLNEDSVGLFFKNFTQTVIVQYKPTENYGGA